MEILLLVALAPVLIVLLYLYSRDKYEKEPIKPLLISLAVGAVITVPILVVEVWLTKFANNFFILTELDGFGQYEYSDLPERFLIYVGYDAFVVASFTEELFKYLAFLLIVWRNRNFNELFDGILYATYISLGFAAVENIFYVIESGVGTGILRALTAVPAHALFGVAMGFYFGLAKFVPAKQTYYMFLAFLVPFLLHGLYDFFLMSENDLLLLTFIPFIIVLWYIGFKKMKSHSEKSVFKRDKEQLG